MEIYTSLVFYVLFLNTYCFTGKANGSSVGDPKHRLVRLAGRRETSDTKSAQWTRLTSTTVLDKTRQDIAEFLVILSPTCLELTTVQMNQIYSDLRDTLTEQFQDKVNEIGKNLTLNYVAISNIDANTNTRSCTTNLTVEESFVSFQAPEGNTPSNGSVNQWAQEAVAFKLLDKLKQSLDFIQAVQVPGVVPENKTATTAETGGKNIPSPDVKPSLSAQPATSRLATAQIILCVLSVLFIFITLATVFLFRRRAWNCWVLPHKEECSPSKTEKEVDVSEHAPDDVSEDSPDSEDHKTISPVEMATLAVGSSTAYGSEKHASNDDQSVGAASESSWTVATEAGDSMALKSLSSKAKTGSSGMNNQAGGMTESFGNDRPLSLTKDMLMSSWSGITPSKDSKPRESVLEPSTFTASEEFERQRMEGGDLEPYVAFGSSSSFDVTVKPWENDLQIKESSPTLSATPGGFLFSEANSSGDVIVFPPSAVLSRPRQMKGTGSPSHGLTLTKTEPPQTKF